MLLNFNELVEKYNLDIRGVIIAGAHKGEEIKTYLKNGIQDIIAFEPVNSNFIELQKRYHQFSRITLVPIGLGAINQSAEIFLENTNDGQSCSFLQPALHLKQYPNITFEGKERTYMMRLDKFMHGIETVLNFMDIDCQGYELEVLKGAPKTLKKIDAIVCEVYRNNVYEGCPMIGEVDEYLSGFGFERMETNWDGGTWGDAFYLKHKS